MDTVDALLTGEDLASDHVGEERGLGFLEAEHRNAAGMDEVGDSSATVRRDRERVVGREKWGGSRVGPDSAGVANFLVRRRGGLNVRWFRHLILRFRLG